MSKPSPIPALCFQRYLFMFMSMMGVREMRMLVAKWFVTVLMDVRARPHGR